MMCSPPPAATDSHDRHTNGEGRGVDRSSLDESRSLDKGLRFKIAWSVADGWKNKISVSLPYLWLLIHKPLVINFALQNSCSSIVLPCTWRNRLRPWITKEARIFSIDRIWLGFLNASKGFWGMCELSFGKETLDNFCSTQKNLALRKNIVGRGKNWREEGVKASLTPALHISSLFLFFKGLKCQSSERA